MRALDLRLRRDPATVHRTMHRFWFYAFYFFGFPLAGGMSRERAQP